MQSEELKPCPMCGADEASTYIGAPGPGVVTCFAVGCGHTIKGFASDAAAIAEWNKRSDAMSAAMTEAYCSEGTEDDTLKECFLHHIRTTIGFLAFGARPGHEMTMYEEGFKAGYRRCQSDNEPDIGEDEDDLNNRTRSVVAKLRESLRKGEVDPLAIDNTVDLLIDQSKALEAALSAAEPQPAPSVAVKALDFDTVYVIPREMTDEEWAEVKYNVDRKANPDIDLWRIKEAVKYANFIAGHRGRSALSAQVQDVVGWQPINEAEKDRTIRLLWSSAWLHPIMGYWSSVQNCWLEYASRDTKANVATHFMPLPAAPAKQEGGTNE